MRQANLTILLFFGLLIFVGCDSTDTNPVDEDPVSQDPGEGGEGGEEKFVLSFMSVIIDGSPWSTTNVIANTGLVEGTQTLEITGVSESDGELVLLIKGDIETQTYGGGDGNLVSISFKETGAPLEETFVSIHYSTVTFTSITTTRLIGTFVFEGTRSTDGLGATGKRGSFSVEFGPGL